MKNPFKGSRTLPPPALRGYRGPDPRTVGVAVPIMDYKPDIVTVMGLMQCAPYFCQPIFHCGSSAINLARNLIAHSFLNTHKHLQWLVWIDADIGFTPEDWCALMDTDEPLVRGAYYKKRYPAQDAGAGFGFVKTHRRVFEAIAGLSDENGAERVGRFFMDGELTIDFFPTGCTPNGQWAGEDQGFFSWAGIAGFPARIEPRCHLIHYGRAGYPLEVTFNMAPPADLKREHTSDR